MKVPLAKATPSPISGASNDEICKFHSKPIEHRCLGCQMWICDNCLDSHSESIGCSIICLSKAMESIREEHTNSVSMLQTIFEDDTNFLLSKIKDHNDKIQELNEKVKHHSEEIIKLQNVVEKGSKQNENLLQSKAHLDAIKSPHSMTDGVERLTQMKQSLRIWSVKNLGSDTLHGLLKAVKEKKDVYTEMIIKNEKMYAKLSKHEENINIHNFRTQSIADGSTCMAFDRLQKMIPSDASLVFIELSISGVIKGRVLFRLNKELPNIREHLVKIAIGQSGKSLSDVKLDDRDSTCIGAYPLNFSDYPVTIDSFVPSTKTVVGDVFGYFQSGYIDRLYFTMHPGTGSRSGNWRIFGRIEEGLNILLDLHKTNNKNAMISECGIVIEKD